ncbi:MAG: hypothetical protein ACI4UN_04240 [Muribaculaceae bacterium]
MKAYLAALACISLISCNNRNSNPSNQIEDGDSCSATVTPLEAVNPNQVGKEITTIGVTLDRAMNSILIIDENGDSIEFDYAEVDNRTKIFGSNIGDTVTVKHVTLADGRDSVTAIYRGRRP